MSACCPGGLLSKPPRAGALLSPLAVVLVILTAMCLPLNAHEIRPAIADIRVQELAVDIEISLTLEALVAGLDLADLQDTNASPLSQEYDQLRAMEPVILEREFLAAWPEIVKGIQLFAGETRLTPAIEKILISPTGNIDLPRESQLILHATLPADNSPVSLGWAAAYGPLVVRQVLDSGDGYSGYLTGGETSTAIPRTGRANQTWLTDFLNYIGIGYEHIIPKGLDHILFVLGLFFFSMHLRPLLTQITSFTLAHTVALALGILGVVQVPPAIVEPLIAASIVYVAVENMMTENYRPWRTAVVFGFGLLHGLGFAAVLQEIGLNSGRFLTGLIGFNIGVELGQITVIASAYLLVGLWFGNKVWYRQRVARPASAAIALIGGYWFVQRVFF